MQGVLEKIDRVDHIAVETDEPHVAVPVRAYRPLGTKNGDRPPAMVFAHAGGWRLCSLDAYDNPCRVLADATGCVVFSVGYRLAPKHPYPVPLEDFVAPFAGSPSMRTNWRSTEAASPSQATAPGKSRRCGDAARA